MTTDQTPAGEAMREAVDASLKATRRPWKVFDQNGVIEIQDADGKEIIHWAGFDQSRRSTGARRANARFIVAISNAIGPIASELARLTAERDEARRERDAAFAAADQQAELRNAAEAEGLGYYHQMQAGVPAMMAVVEGAKQSEARALAAEAALTTIRAEHTAEIAKLRIAFHDAIRRPLGVTPDSGAEFYDARMADQAEARRAALAKPETTDV